ncbi:hypothetical protein QOT17_014158 [Balamuthia mandrillaris]
MAATKHNIAGSCLGWFALAFLFLSLILPWYLTALHSENLLNGEDCTISNVFFWAHSICSSSGDCKHDVVCGSKDIHAFWGEANNHLDEVYAPAFFLLLFATVAAFMAALSFSARCCCMGEEVAASSFTVVSLVCFIFEVLGLLTLTTAVIFFAAALPRAWRDNVDEQAVVNPGPWDSFIGHHKYSRTLEPTTFEYNVAWAPVGWWLALLGWPFFLATAIAQCFTLRSTRGEAGYSIVEEYP